MDIYKIGSLIAAERKKLGMTQESLGTRLGVTAKAVSKWERGLSYPDITLIGKLANELKISIVELLFGEESRSSVCYIDEKEAISPVSLNCDDELTLSFEDDRGFVVSPYLFGENLEHTRANIYLGLSAQMLKNRKFVGKTMACRGYSTEWYPIGDKVFFAHSEPYTRHDEKFYHMKRRNECHTQQITNLYGGISGIGQHGLCIRQNANYEFRIVIKSTASLTVCVALTDRNGIETYASCEFIADSNEWSSHSMTLQSTKTDNDADIRITFEGEGSLFIGCVSLMQEGHFRGMRRDVIDLLKDMGIHILRWPGGNFAGEYCWYDGLMPVDMRAPFASYLWSETQSRSGGYDFHEINTDDFIALCREIGAEPYITINPTWNTPEENAAWVEYCNGDANTPFGAMRSERGFPAPYDVHFWSLGNEFGYGHMEGDNTPYGYSQIAMKNAEKMLSVSDKLCLCTCGPYPNSEWVAHAAKPMSAVAQLVSMHYYAPSPTYADPVILQKEYELCLGAVEIARRKLHILRCNLDESLKISFDEWNTWNAWYRPSSVTDGIFTALMLHMLIEEAENLGIVIACHFEAVNEGMIETNPEGASLTASGQAFALIQQHAGGRLMHASANAAASKKDNVIVVTVVNPSFGNQRQVIIPREGMFIEAFVYAAERILPYTRFEVEPVQTRLEGDTYTFIMPPHSLLFARFQIGS